ncbi:MAG: hypothetical protein PUC66_01930 [Erysipelotrichaceae bacterium]|nr:hypothetical protein [Erysipelotrichaceae bacterium]
MTLYEILQNEQRPTLFSRSQEQLYYNENSYRLNELESFHYLMNPTDSFGVVCGNVILRALENKATIERLLKAYEKNKDDISLPFADYMQNGMANLPYLDWHEEKNYVPVFPSSIAALYAKDFQKLREAPYSAIVKDYEDMMIDPFDYYGYSVFVSYFTSLVLVRQNENCAALYDFDASCLYFVNDEGRLDAKLCLFDRDISHPVLTHLMPRLSKVAERYFANDREGMLKALQEGNLISAHLIEKIHHRDQKMIRQREKRIPE